MNKESFESVNGNKDTELGSLPGEWKVVKLLEVCEKTKQIDPHKNPGQEIKYVDVSSISNDSLKIISATQYLGENAPSRAKKLMASNDIIFATVRPYLRRIAMVPESLNGQICSTAFCVIRPQLEKTDPNYLFFAVIKDDFIQRVSLHQRGASYPAVTDKDVLNQIIPLPILSEQKAIAHVLQVIQEAKEKAEELIRATKELKKSMMKHLFTYGPVPSEEAERVKLKETEIGMMPEEWEVTKLGEICERPQYGLTASSVEIPVGPKFLRITDIQEGSVDWASVPYCKCSTAEHEKHKLSPGDIVIARIGATTGKTYCTQQCSDVVFASYLIRIRVKPAVLYGFLWQYTNTKSYWSQINAAKGGRLKQGINIPIMTNLVVPLPPLAIQRQINDILSAIDAKIEAEEKKKNALEGLFKTLLHDLMTAKIRVNNLPLEA
jgi:type I restriction enzyme S subunit